MITEKQKLFLRLKIVEGKKYDEIQEILDKSRKTLGFWWKDLKAERNTLRIIVDKWKKKWTVWYFMDGFLGKKL